jgi:hypothetical protein
VSETVRSSHLCNALAELAASPLADVRGAVVLKRLISKGLGQPDTNDLTGFEALTNKIHVSDYVDTAVGGDQLLVQGFMYAERLAERLATVGSPFRIVLSRDPDEGDVTVRFFVRRTGIPWGPDDPEAFKIDEVAQWDVPQPTSPVT